MTAGATLVTGASGFIGRHVVNRLLERGAEVWAVVRSPASDLPRAVLPIRTSLAERGWTSRLPEGAVDSVVHLAQSRRHREFPAATADVFDVNVAATVDLADWARARGVRRFVFCSTGNVYGTAATNVREVDPLAPANFYAATKASAELLLRPFASFMEIVVVRIFGAYGPGQRGAMIPQVIERLASGRDVELAQGKGVNMNPLYVEDCAGLIADLIAAPVGERFEVFNLGGPVTTDLAQIVAMLAPMIGRTASIRVTPEPPIALVGRIEKLMRHLGARDFTTLEEGLRRTVAGSEIRQ